MLIKAEQKYVRTSPQKLREVSRGFKKITNPEKVIEYLRFSDKRAARPLAKTLMSAIANAKSRGLTSELSIKEVQVGEGPTMKRWRAASRGMAHRILKRTSHIRIILETKEGGNAEPSGTERETTPDKRSSARSSA
ncbi:50S ribosomal protein L22 [Candidatus Microgenomates bacterium]|nr:50S ribosomal protein L22 [Candidatus Microgenomates bacterium]